MQNMTSRTIEAFGLKWHLSAATIEAEQGRKELEAIALSYHAGLNKPAAKLGAYNLFFPYYPDILAACDEIEDNESLLESWFINPGEWVKWLRGQIQDGKRDDLSDLWQAAKNLNPDWYPELISQDDEVKQAESEMEALGAFVDSPNDNPHPDTSEVTKNAATVAGAAETKAKEAGKVGPVTFRTKGKGAA